jgi:hypothetical protein
VTDVTFGSGILLDKGCIATRLSKDLTPMTWKTLLMAAPVAASLLAANTAQAGWGGHGGGGHGGGGHEHFDRGGSRHFDHRGGLIFGALGLGALFGGAVVAQQQYYAQPAYQRSGY